MRFPVFTMLALLISGLNGCNQEYDYEQLVHQQLSKGVRCDSLFLGYSFAMKSKDFFKHSWELNQKHIVTGASRIEYEMTELSEPARMVFYPDFHDDQIYRMPVEISFKSWAPWNRHLYSDSLIIELVELYKKKYGTDFIKTIHPDYTEESWIKVDGNRRISIFRKDDMTVRIEFLDLTVNRKK